MRHIDVVAVLARVKTAKGVVQDQELAHILGVSRTTLSSWKQRGSIPAKYLMYMADISDRSVDWLLDGSDHRKELELPEEAIERYIPADILWMALKLVAKGAGDDQDASPPLVQALTDGGKAHAYLFFHLASSIVKLMDAKAKWEKSGLVAGDDVIRAVATEVGLAPWEDPDAIYRE